MMNKTFIKIIALLSLSLVMLAIVEINFKNGDSTHRKQQQVSNDNSLKILLRTFHSINVFLIDNDLLTDISLYKNSSFLEISFEKLIYNKHHANEFYASFGIFHDKIDIITEILVQMTNIKCFVNRRYTHTNEITQILTLVLLDCNNNKYKIAIHVFYNRGDFLYIPSLENQNISHIKWYNDVPRALQRFDLVTIKDSFMNEIKIPADLKRYFYDYGHSRFIECNSKLAEWNIQQSNGTYFQDKKKNEKIMPCFIHLTMELEKLYKHYYLTSGSLLGWYRDCGVIPHTTDMDLTLWSNEYDSRIIEAFLGNPIVHLWSSMGRVRHSLELRMKGCDFKYDLFFMYKITDKKQCTYFHSDKTVFPGCFPIFTDLCSGEILGHKFIVACKPEDLLHKLYGYNTWKLPKLTQFELYSMLWQHGMNRSLTDLPYMYRYYSENGSLLLNKTLERINLEYYPLTGRNLTELPSEENEYL